jgi:hypothetical protein
MGTKTYLKAAGGLRCIEGLTSILMLINFESVKHERIHEHLDPMASQSMMSI